MGRIVTGVKGVIPATHPPLGPSAFAGPTGKRDDAREHLSTATTMYREMDMRFWLEQAEAEMKELA